MGYLIDRDIDGKRVFGNAMSVPVLGSVLGQVCKWWRRTHLDIPMVPTTSPPIPRVGMAVYSNSSSLASLLEFSEADAQSASFPVQIDSEEDEVRRN